MSKDQLIEKLKLAFATEEAAAISIRNITSTFHWSGLTIEQRTRAVELLQGMAEAAHNRALRLRGVIKSVEASRQNVF